MADEKPPEGTVAPAAPAAAPAAVAAPAAPEGPPPWLAQRLEEAKLRAQESLLKELGVTDPAKAKAAIAAAAKADEDAKSAAQKLGETSKAFETEKQRGDRYEAVIKDHAARAISPLTDAQKAAVRVIAPDTDPAAQLRAIDALTPTWTSSATTTAAATVAAAPATPAAGTAPPADAPASSTATVPNHAKVYAELEKANPFTAATYALSHSHEIYKS